MPDYCTIPLAKAQIRTTLQARVGLAGVLVQWGYPMESPADRERIFIDDAKSVDRAWAGLGQLRVDETYKLTIHAEVFQEGDDAMTCELRMWAIVAEVERAVLNDITLAGILTWGAKPSAMDPKCFPSGDGWWSVVALTFDCSARIAPS